MAGALSERSVKVKNNEKYTTVDEREKAFRGYDRQETIADIVSEMRNEGHTGDASCLEWVGAKMQRYADRIEAAANHHFREVTKMMPHEEVASAKIETTAPAGEKSSAVGNSSAMRDALEKTQSAIATCMEILNKIPDGCDYDGLVDEVADELCDLRESHVNAALSAPPRNCDVGTVDAQVSRYNKFCMQRTCRECPFSVSSELLACGVRWAQTPCEEA